jgi:PAS domain S-box-containing protein
MISILYVDDDPDLLELCRVFLEQTGEFRIDTVESAVEALVRLSEKQYDAVISDFQMPEMDGISLLKSIRLQSGDLPFILFTGRGREEVVIEALNNGADFYLQKGGDTKAQFAELMHKVRQAVDKRQAEQDLQESEKRLTDIINFLPDATFAIDRDGKVIAWNRAIEDLTGVSAAEMIGKGDHEYAIPFYGHRRPILIDLIFEPDELIQKNYAGISRENKVLIAESDLPRPRGKQLTIMGKASPLYDRQGNLAGAIESIRDITARKQAEDDLRAAYEEIRTTEEELREQYDLIAKNEQAIKDSEEKYRTLVENNRDIIYIYRDDRILVINQRGPEVLEYSEEELRTMLIWDLIHPEDRKRLFERGRARMQGENIPTQYTARIMTKSGRAIPMEMIAVLVTYRGERAIMGIARDVTEREEYVRGIARKSTVLTIINRIIQIASQKRDMGELLDTTLSLIGDQLGYDTGAIYLIDETTSKARIVCSQNMPAEFIRISETIDIHEQPYSTVFIAGSPIIGKNYETVDPELSRKFGIKSFACIPIMAEDRVIGSLNIASSHRPGIPADESEVLSAIGKELGNAIMRMKVEAALKESEAHYRTLIETTGTGFVILDDQGRVMDANPEYVRLSGHTALSEIMGRPVVEWTAPDDQEKNTRAVLECLRKGYVRNFEVDYRDSSGGITPIELNATVLTSKGSVQIVTLCRDISSRRKAEEALRSSERQYRSMIENVQDMLYRTDMEGKITMISPAGAEQAGYDSPDEMIGLDLARTLYVDPQERKKFLAILAKKHSVNAYPLVLKARDGRIYHVTANSHYFYDADGHVLGVEGLIHDVTHIRQAEDALKEANRKLNLLNSITRHDVANQLTVIQGYIQLAMIKNPDPMIGDFLHKIDTGTATITRQIEFSKTYQELGVQAPDWFSLEEIFSKNKPKDILFSSSCNGTEVYADPMLEKVFANLFGNSIMHGERVSRITVRCEPSGEDLLITVEDNGVGIPLDIKQKIFKKGFGKNTGFGLFLAREILAITNIMIHETGIHGRGARFEIIVPKGGFRYGRSTGRNP